MPDMMVAGLCNFITSLDKIMASQQVVIAISRICIMMVVRNGNIEHYTEY
jgi:hypothetical protein